MSDDELKKTIEDFGKIAAALTALDKDETATMRYDAMSDALIWSDEVPEQRRARDI